MGVTSFAGAGLARENGGEWAGGRVAGFVGGGAGGKTFQGGLDCREVVEGVEAVGTAAEFAGSLRATEDQEAENGGLVAAEIEDGADAMLVLGDSGVADYGGECLVFERVESLADLFFGEIDDGIAAGALVACIDQGVEGQRVVFRRGDLFFNKGAEDAELDGVEMHGYKGATAAADWQR
jgi:hypothetical protein